ncbi:MAG TPA: lanthionine synthetase LanC family protein [Actinocrinis sp.]|nr:lanthionine synthetase LanC family protein [Actinocrinis sp.]
MGKIVTAYPQQGRVRELGLELAQALRGHQGPRVLSDRRVSRSAPVYYRYGPFTRTEPVFDEHGRALTALSGPGGERFEADATLRYRQPSWIRDPFTGLDSSAGPDDTDPSAALLLGKRYRAVSGIREAAQGNVYRAIDQTDGSAVVVKQGRAFVAERGDVDARMRLRNERRVLNALAGVPGVPRFVDHFRQGDDEFLVTQDRGGASLARDVLENGPRPPGTGPRGLDPLAAKLASTLREIHERGVIMRDLSPNNVVVDGEEVTVLDFGLSAYRGTHLPGGTPGYAPARQFQGQEPCEDDDLYALGMTLLFAATGLDPVTLDPDEADTARTQALRAVHARAGASPAGIWCEIARLLGEPQDTRPARGQGAGRLPAPVRVTCDLAAQIVANLRSDLLHETARILESPSSYTAPRDLAMHSGAAGIGLELLRHGELEPVRGLVSDLACHIARFAGEKRLPPGLFNGSMGISVFLSEARSCGIEIDRGETDRGYFDDTPDRYPPSTDVIGGAAGVGLGHLSLLRTGGDPAHLAAARRCAHLLAGRHIPEAVGGGGGAHKAVEPSAGAAHGLAGIVEFFIALAEHSGAGSDLETAERRCGELAVRARTLTHAARSPSAHPLAASWCQGLAGIGRTLLHGSAVLHAPALAALASDAADAALSLLPWMSNLGQCCGAAGVGSLLIDLAVQEDDERYWQASGQVADHILARGAGPPEHPRLVASSHDTRAASWAAGTAGILGFFRRLALRGGPETIPLWAGQRSSLCRAPRVVRELAQ